jgi:hypothetical protein
LAILTVSSTNFDMYVPRITQGGNCPIPALAAVIEVMNTIAAQQQSGFTRRTSLDDPI